MDECASYDEIMNLVLCQDHKYNSMLLQFMVDALNKRVQDIVYWTQIILNLWYFPLPPAPPQPGQLCTGCPSFRTPGLCALVFRERSKLRFFLIFGSSF